MVTQLQNDSILLSLNCVSLCPKRKSASRSTLKIRFKVRKVFKWVHYSSIEYTDTCFLILTWKVNAITLYATYHKKAILVSYTKQLFCYFFPFKSSKKNIPVISIQIVILVSSILLGFHFFVLIMAMSIIVYNDNLDMSKPFDFVIEKKKKHTVKFTQWLRDNFGCKKVWKLKNLNRCNVPSSV